MKKLKKSLVRIFFLEDAYEIQKSKVWQKTFFTCKLAIFFHLSLITFGIINPVNI